MKKVLLFIVGFLLIGCEMLMNTPIKRTEELLSKYQSFDEDISKQLDSAITGQNFTDTQANKYKDIMKKQYKDLIYVIEEDKTDGNKSTVEVTIEVYDYAKVKTEANEHINNNQNDFYVNGELDEEKVNNYILDKLTTVEERIRYRITVNLTKSDKNWKVEQLSNENIEKINGFYSN